MAAPRGRPNKRNRDNDLKKLAVTSEDDHGALVEHALSTMEMYNAVARKLPAFDLRSREFHADLERISHNGIKVQVLPGPSNKAAMNMRCVITPPPTISVSIDDSESVSMASVIDNVDGFMRAPDRDAALDFVWDAMFHAPFEDADRQCWHSRLTGPRGLGCNSLWFFIHGFSAMLETAYEESTSKYRYARDVARLFNCQILSRCLLIYCAVKGQLLFSTDIAARVSVLCAICESDLATNPHHKGSESVTNVPGSAEEFIEVVHAATSLSALVSLVIAWIDPLVFVSSKAAHCRMESDLYGMGWSPAHVVDTTGVLPLVNTTVAYRSGEANAFTSNVSELSRVVRFFCNAMVATDAIFFSDNPDPQMWSREMVIPPRIGVEGVDEACSITSHLVTLAMTAAETVHGTIRRLVIWLVTHAGVCEQDSLRESAVLQTAFNVDLTRTSTKENACYQPFGARIPRMASTAICMMATPSRETSVHMFSYYANSVFAARVGQGVLPSTLKSFPAFLLYDMLLTHQAEADSADLALAEVAAQQAVQKWSLVHQVVAFLWMLNEKEFGVLTALVGFLRHLRRFNLEGVSALAALQHDVDVQNRAHCRAAYYNAVAFDRGVEVAAARLGPRRRSGASVLHRAAEVVTNEVARIATCASDAPSAHGAIFTNATFAGLLFAYDLTHKDDPSHESDMVWSAPQVFTGMSCHKIPEADEAVQLLLRDPTQVNAEYLHSMLERMDDWEIGLDGIREMARCYIVQWWDPVISSLLMNGLVPRSVCYNGDDLDLSRPSSRWRRDAALVFSPLSNELVAAAAAAASGAASAPASAPASSPVLAPPPASVPHHAAQAAPPAPIAVMSDLFAAFQSAQPNNALLQWAQQCGVSNWEAGVQLFCFAKMVMLSQPLSDLACSVVSWAWQFTDQVVNPGDTNFPNSVLMMRVPQGGAEHAMMEILDAFVHMNIRASSPPLQHQPPSDVLEAPLAIDLDPEFFCNILQQ